MKAFRLHLLLGLFSLFVAGSAFAVRVNVSGNILYAYSFNTPAAGATVMICTSPTAEPWTCVGPTTDGAGHYSISNWAVGNQDRLYFFPHTDTPSGGRTGRWGSTTAYVYAPKACNTTGICGTRTLTFNHALLPSPLEPVAVNPAPGQIDVELTQTMKWTNSSDSWRTNSYITYDIYGSGYGSPLILEVSDLPCNADANNHCQWELPINLDPQTPYNWKIVAKAYYGFTTESQVYHFSTGW